MENLRDTLDIIMEKNASLIELSTKTLEDKTNLENEVDALKTQVRHLEMEKEDLLMSIRNSDNAKSEDLNQNRFDY